MTGVGSITVTPPSVTGGITVTLPDGVALSVERGPEPPTITVLPPTTGPQGPEGRQGEPGPPGPSSGGALYPAAHALSGHRLVAVQGGAARYPDLGVPGDAYALAGLTTGAAEAGAPVVVETGLLEEPSWAWTPGSLIYAGPAGTLSLSPPESGWLRIVGVAQTPTSLLVALREPIMREF